MRLGLQAKIILCFMALFCLAMGVSSWTFAHLNTERLSDLMGEQARHVFDSERGAVKRVMELIDQQLQE